MRKKIRTDKTLTGDEVRDSIMGAFPDYEIKTKNQCKTIFVRVSKRSGLKIVKYNKMLRIADWNRGVLAKAIHFHTDWLFSDLVKQKQKKEIAKFISDKFAAK